MGLHEPVDGDSTLTASSDGIDGKLGAGVHIAANEDIGFRGLIGKAVCNCTISAAQFHLGTLQQITPQNALTDGQEYPVAGNGLGVIFIICRCKLAVFIPYADAALEDDAGYTAVFSENFLGAPAAVDCHILFQSFCDFFFGGGHLVPRLQAEHSYRLCAAALGGSCHVDGHIAAANNYSLAGYRIAFVSADSAKEVHGGHDTFCILTGDTRFASALAADGNVECLVTLCTQFVQRHVLAHFNAALDLHAHGLDDVDFGIDHIFLQLEAGDAVAEHTAGLFVLFENHGGVTLFSQIESTA